MAENARTNLTSGVMIFVEREIYARQPSSLDPDSLADAERMSAASLAQEFEVSVRTTYRNIDHMSAAGGPAAHRG